MSCHHRGPTRCVYRPGGGERGSKENEGERVWYGGGGKAKRGERK